MANATPPASIPDYNRGVSEDCLFLDVYVPRKVLNEAGNKKGALQGAPVLFWV